MGAFLEKWLAAVDKKNSVLCAGLDPAEFDMGRGDKGLAQGESKGNFARRYVESVAPYCAALKPNIQYWKGVDDGGWLTEIVNMAKQMGMVVIDDSKLADIGSTNDAGMYHSAMNGFDAVTIAPYAGNMKEAADQARSRNLGCITMCLMSNPEYENEKNMLVDISGESNRYHPFHIQKITGDPYVPRFVKLAHDAQQYGLDGIVIGAPSEKNHISIQDIQAVRAHVKNDMLVLLPGVGAQGGEAGAIWQHFAYDKVIVNVGRSLMLLNGSGSTPDDQAGAAKHYKEMLNNLRS